MTTRFYTANDTPATVSPSVNGTWGATGSALNRLMSPWKTGSATNQTQGSTISWTTGQSALDRAMVSARLRGDGTLSGTVKAYALAHQTGSANARTRLEIYVVSADGATVRGTALSLGSHGNNTNLQASTNRSVAFAISGTTLSSVSYQDGDRIVAKWGYSDASGSSPTASAAWGDPQSVADLPENETNSTGEAWIEFSQTLSLYQPAENLWERASAAATSITSGSHTPSSGSVQIVVVHNEQASPNLPTITTTTGLTFTQIATSTGGNSRTTAFYAIAAAGGSNGTVKADFAGQSQAVGVMWWEEWTGVDLATPVINSVTGNNGATTGAATLTLTYASTPAIDNVLVAAFMQGSSNATQTQRSGWGLDRTGSFDGLETIHRRADGNDASASATVVSGGVLIGLAFELRTSLSQTSGSVTLGALTGSGAVTSEDHAAGAVTLDAMTGVATATSEDHAADASTLAAMSGTGVVTVLGQTSGSVTLGALTGSGVTTVLVQATGALTLAAMTGAAAVSELATAAASVTLAALTGSSTFIAATNMVGAATFAPLTGSANILDTLPSVPSIWPLHADDGITVG